MIFAFFGAVLVGVSLGLLGSGGSILTVPVLVYLVGHAKKSAIVESLAIVGIIALCGALLRARRGEVDFRAAVLFALVSIPGAYLGTLIGSGMRGAWQLVILAVLMFAAAALMFRGSGAARSGPAEPNKKRHPAVVLPVGAGVGMLTGVAGIGGGFLFVPALTVAAGIPMRRAIGTSLLLIAVNCATGLAGYMLRPASERIAVDWATVGVFGAVGVAGVLVGQRIASRLSQRALKRAFSVFLVIIGAFMLARESAKLGSSPAPPDSSAQQESPATD